MRVQLASLALGVTLLMAVTASAQYPTGAAQNPPPRADPEIRTTLERLYAAWSDLDPAKTARFYAKDPDLAFFDVAPMKYTGWAEYAAGVPKAFANYRSGKFTLNDDLRVHRHGNQAWATATWRGELTKKAGGIEQVAGRYTAVLETRGKDWLVLHEHMSVPLGGDKEEKR
jgi:ketosteroid isomerase-like protein